VLDRNRLLVFRVRSRLCALPVSEVVETMRVLPIAAIGHTERAYVSPFVLGAAVIRGAPVPVVDVGGLLENEGGAAAHTRFVVVQIQESGGGRRVALAVEEVLGVRDVGSLDELPPLLREARSETISRIGLLDAELLLLLRAGRLLPEAFA
jgi:purine-binding chemotaxis protein CheW